MRVMVSQITSLTIVYSSVYSGADQRKHQSSASLAFVRGIQRWLVNSLHKGPVTQKMFPFDDVIMLSWQLCHHCIHGCQYDCLQWYQWCEGPGYLCGCRTLNINCHPLMILFLKEILTRDTYNLFVRIFCKFNQSMAWYKTAVSPLL